MKYISNLWMTQNQVSGEKEEKKILQHIIGKKVFKKHTLRNKRIYFVFKLYYKQMICKKCMWFCKLVWLCFAFLIANIGIYTLHHNCVCACTDYIIYLTTGHVIYTSHDNVLCSWWMPQFHVNCLIFFFCNLSASDNKCLRSGSHKIEI